MGTRSRIAVLVQSNIVGHWGKNARVSFCSDTYSYHWAFGGPITGFVFRMISNVIIWAFDVRLKVLIESDK